MNFSDMTRIFSKYENKWVALTDDNKVIAVATTLNAVLKKARQKGHENPLTARIPDSKFEYVL